jgi:hypothetical protein
VGPGEAEEASFLADQRAAGEIPGAGTAARTAAPQPDASGELPPLDELVRRIPGPTRALIDELFRAKFMTVKRLPPAAFKQ